MGHVLRGLGLVLRDARLRAYAWRPLAQAAMVWVVLLVAGGWVLVPWIGGWLEGLGLGSALAGLLGLGAYAAVWFWLGGTFYMAVAGVLSSFLWERLSDEVEAKVGTPVARTPVSTGAIALDTVGRGCFSVAIAASALVFGWWCVPIAVLLVGWLGLLDYTSCAFLRRGLPFGAQFGRVFRCRGWAGFALVAGLVGWVPVLNLLMLPVLVAGGAVMVSATDPKDLR